MKVAGVELTATQRVGGGDICMAWRGRTSAGTEVFAKTLDAAPAGFFDAEAAGLDRLRVADGPPLPEVVAVAADGLVLSWVEPAGPTPSGAAELGRRLAQMHDTTLPHFGAEEPGFIGSLPLDNTPGEDWPTFYAQRRLLPFLAGLDRDVHTAVERVVDRLTDIAGPAAPPARIHGDLWSGNVLWSTGGTAWLVDAASAHGGHRETDLAMLALFGAPHLEVVMASYQEAAALHDGWRQRQPLHQLHPLLVHAQLFGGSYCARVIDAARAAAP